MSRHLTHVRILWPISRIFTHYKPPAIARKFKACMHCAVCNGDDHNRTNGMTMMFGVWMVRWCIVAQLREFLTRLMVHGYCMHITGSIYTASRMEYATIPKPSTRSSPLPSFHECLQCQYTSLLSAIHKHERAYHIYVQIYLPILHWTSSVSEIFFSSVADGGTGLVREYLPTYSTRVFFFWKPFLFLVFCFRV